MSDGKGKAADELTSVVSRAVRFSAALGLHASEEDAGAYQQGWDDGREALKQELHEERNQTSIRDGRLGLRVDELEAALRESLESSHIDLDRLRGVLEAGLPRGRPVVHDAARHDPEIGSAGWTAKLLKMLDGSMLVAAVGGRESRRWCVWTPGRPSIKSDEVDVREALATVFGMLEAMSLDETDS